MKTWEPPKTENDKATKALRSAGRGGPRAGGRMTISPPANVKLPAMKEARGLAYGVDTLVVAIDVTWISSNLFRYLEKLKIEAKGGVGESPGILMTEDKSDEWHFNVKAHGVKGYEWLLDSREFTLRIGNWKSPQSRPSVMAEIGSESLHVLGPGDAVNRIIGLLEDAGGSIVGVKASRVDLYIDILLPECVWSLGLMKYAVTRASDVSPHFRHGQLTGISIGKGVVSARIYDKFLEIKQQSKKFWMFDVWGVDKVPEGKKIIRVEFQLRREGIKEMRLETLDDFLENIENVWAYCTNKWLKFQDHPGAHHTQRFTLKWWEVVQNGFNGVQDPKPIVRSKAFRTDVIQLMRQAFGQITSLQAALLEEQGAEINKRVDMFETVEAYLKVVDEDGKDERALNENIALKRARYHRVKTKVDKRKTALIDEIIAVVGEFVVCTKCGAQFHVGLPWKLGRFFGCIRGCGSNLFVELSQWNKLHEGKGAVNGEIE